MSCPFISSIKIQFFSVSGQNRIKEDLVKVGPTLKAWAADGVPMLVICGLYQLFGHGFTTAKGHEIPGISRGRALKQSMPAVVTRLFLAHPSSDVLVDPIRFRRQYRTTRLLAVRSLSAVAGTSAGHGHP